MFSPILQVTALPRGVEGICDYFSSTRTRLFVHLQEIEFPKSFRWAEVARWTKKIAGKSRRAFVEQKLAALRRIQSRVEGVLPKW